MDQLREAEGKEGGGEEGKKEGREEGKKEGREEGKKEGRQEGKQEGLREGMLVGKVQLLEQLLGEAETPAADLEQQAPAELLKRLDALRERLRTRSE